MSRRKNLLALGLIMLFGLAIGLSWNLLAQDESKADRIARRDFMRAKMMYSSNILQGLTNHDFEAVEESANEIVGLTRAEAWLVVKDEAYQEMSEDLRVAAERLKKSAKEKNVEGSTLRFFDMTIKCIDCHEHIRNLEF
jgi:hypothetical protein